MSEVIRHRPWGDSVPIEFVTASDYDQLKADNERLASAIRYEQHLADRIGTHGPDCWSWGNAHYECLKRKHQQDVGESILERDTLRKQLTESQANDRCAMAYLADVRAVVGGTDFVCMVHNVTQMKQQLDEARELLKDYGYAAGDLDGRVDAWLEANKP